jgi:hypothetical protein
MKRKGNVSDYVKANRKGSREAEFAVSAGWTSKTKVHKSKKQYDRKGQNWKNDSDLFPFKNQKYSIGQFFKINNCIDLIYLLNCNLNQISFRI